ncbi:response regulator [Niveispirillum sp. KHB5.9]|uniref:response regulator n=1 Tax=Niveispirillum sp. KHB5.9 TaxID=3400269 RepID=UPI003A8748AA
MGIQKRILVVEDEFLIAIHVADIMGDLGFNVIGPVGDIQQALPLAAQESLDGAILDVNLSGQLVFPVAATLASRGVPFILTSGYDASGLPVEWHDRPILRKPVVERDLARLALSVFEMRENAQVAGVGQG